jgi:tetratricopeptide (TPR) repeat protein
VGAGIVSDLVELIGRLGHVRASSLGGEGKTAWERGALDASSPKVLSVLMAGRSSDLFAVLRCQLDSERLVLSVALLARDGSQLWSGQAELADGSLCSARLALAADLIEASTGWRTDLRRFREGSSNSLAPYLLCCAARAPALKAAARVALLRQATATEPSYLEAHLLLADAEEADGAPDSALDLLADVSARAPSYACGRMRYGLALRLAGQHEMALAEVQAALESDPCGTVLFSAGLFADTEGDCENAALFFERAGERGCVDGAPLGRGAEPPDAEDPAAWLRFAVGARDGRRWGDAADAFSEVVRILGTHALARSEQALAMLALGRGHEALRLAMAARAEAPDDVAVASNLGLVLMETGSLDEARVLFLEARERAPRDPIVVLCRAELERRCAATLRAAEGPPC